MQRKKVTHQKKKGPQKKENVEPDHGMHLLRNKFLFEIYKLIRNRHVTKAHLVSKVNVSPAYLSQVFHGKKPLTFQMVDRIQDELKIEFEITIKTHDRSA